MPATFPIACLLFLIGLTFWGVYLSVVHKWGKLQTGSRRLNATGQFMLTGVLVLAGIGLIVLLIRSI